MYGDFSPNPSKPVPHSIAVNSGPSSNRICSVYSFDQEKLRQAMKYIVDRKCLPALMHKHFLVYSSITVSKLTALQLCVLVIAKSWVQTRLVCSRPQPYAHPMVKPQSSSPGLFLRDLQPLPSPSPLHILVVDMPAITLKQCTIPSVSIPSVLAG